MGTQYHITLVANQGETLNLNVEQLQLDIDAQLVEINQIMSTYIPDSELMQFNRAPVNQVQALSKHLMNVFNIAQTVSQKSNGFFDITVAPLVNLWGFGPNMQPQKIPSREALALAQEHVGYEYLLLNQKGAVRLSNIQVDLSAVAKGYGVDWMIDFLQMQGIANMMVEIGGEVRTLGVNAHGVPWKIAIEQPALLQTAAQLVLEMKNMSIATSGDYRNYFEVEGKRFSHTIDPFTGKPITHNLASVTVVDSTAAYADAWATALNVLGPVKGMALAERENLAVYMIVKTENTFTDLQSTAFKQLIH